MKYNKFLTLVTCSLAVTNKFLTLVTCCLCSKTVERRNQRESRSSSPRSPWRSQASDASGHPYSATTQAGSEAVRRKTHHALFDLNEPADASPEGYESGPESSNIGGGGRMQKKGFSRDDCVPGEQSVEEGFRGWISREGRGVLSGEVRTESSDQRSENRVSEVDQVALAACTLDEKSVGKRSWGNRGVEETNGGDRSWGLGKQGSGLRLREETAECEPDRALKIARLGFPETAGELVSEESPRISSISHGADDSAAHLQNARGSPLKGGRAVFAPSSGSCDLPEGSFLQLGPSSLQLGSSGIPPNADHSAQAKGAAERALGGAGSLAPFSAPFSAPSRTGPQVSMAQWPGFGYPPAHPNGITPEEQHRFFRALQTSAASFQNPGCFEGPPVAVQRAPDPELNQTGQFYTPSLEMSRGNGGADAAPGQGGADGRPKDDLSQHRTAVDMQEFLGHLMKGTADRSAVQYPFLGGGLFLPGQHPFWFMPLSAQQSMAASFLQPGSLAFAPPVLANPALLSASNRVPSQPQLPRQMEGHGEP
jgi:hypothetical protein